MNKTHTLSISVAIQLWIMNVKYLIFFKLHLYCRSPISYEIQDLLPYRDVIICMHAGVNSCKYLTFSFHVIASGAIIIFCYLPMRSRWYPSQKKMTLWRALHLLNIFLKYRLPRYQYIDENIFVRRDNWVLNLYALLEIQI